MYNIMYVSMCVHNKYVPVDEYAYENEATYV